MEAAHRRGTPRDFGPCGDVLDRNTPLLFAARKAFAPTSSPFWSRSIRDGRARKSRNSLASQQCQARKPPGDTSLLDYHAFSASLSRLRSTASPAVLVFKTPQALLFQP